MFSRNTYLEVNLKHLKRNIKLITKINPNYKYYIGVVKAECYGQGNGGTKAIRTIIQSGCNYLAVATLDEALDIRKKFTDIPILCMGVISSQYIETCIQNNITVTIPSIEYLEEIIEEDCEGLKVHLKINTGMNRLGINTNKDVLKAIDLIKDASIIIEGIYTHIYEAKNKEKYLKQLDKFQEILNEIDLSKVPIVHISASEALMNYEKPDFINGCRLGIVMYGFTNQKALGLESTIRLISEVIQIHTLQEGEIVGYNGAYEATKTTKIAVVSIGYADGIIRKNTGRYVFINNKEYKIVGNICMDMLFVEVDEKVKVHDEVEILKDNEHIMEVARYLETIPYEILCTIGKRVPREYIS